LLVRGIAARAYAGFESGRKNWMPLPELSGGATAGESGGRAAHRVNGSCDCRETVMNRRGFARSIEERFLGYVARLVRRSERGRKDRATSLGMTGVGSLVEMVAKINC
jgi:hypothetical protein